MPRSNYNRIRTDFFAEVLLQIYSTLYPRIHLATTDMLNILDDVDDAIKNDNGVAGIKLLRNAHRQFYRCDIGAFSHIKDHAVLVALKEMPNVTIDGTTATWGMTPALGLKEAKDFFDCYKAFTVNIPEF